MSDTDNDTNTDTITPPDELETLKARATQMNIQFHPSIGLEKLREKVNAALSGASSAPVEAAPEVEAEETPAQRRARKKREANELIRIRISCMNPAKKEWEGEIFTAGNGVVGSFTKYVPYNVEDGWHVPRIILNQIQQRQCQIFVTSRDERGNQTRKGKLIKEFNVEILPPLTPEELHDLAQRQAMAKGGA